MELPEAGRPRVSVSAGLMNLRWRYPGPITFGIVIMLLMLILGVLIYRFL